MRLWDARNIGAGTGSSGIGGMKHVAELPHFRSVNSAHFSPTGEWMATVCQDDKIRLYQDLGSASGKQVQALMDARPYWDTIQKDNNAGLGFRFFSPQEHTLLIGGKSFFLKESTGDAPVKQHAQTFFEAGTTGFAILCKARCPLFLYDVSNRLIDPWRPLSRVFCRPHCK